MIYCPSCGTANRKGSRFCNECGEPLPSTGTRCPMCGTTNPVGNVYCEKCNARLVPLTTSPEEEEGRAIKGISLPSIALEEESGEVEEKRDEEVGEEAVGSGDWLAELRGSATDEVEELETASPPDEGVEPDESFEIPAWLQEMGPLEEEAESAVGEEPPTAEPPASAAGAPGEISEEEVPAESVDLPAWLRDVAPPEVEAPQAAPEPVEIPGWLREMGPVEEEAPTPSTDEPAFVEAPPEVEAEVEVEEPPSAAESPPEETEPEEPRPEPAALPEWLRDLAPSEAEAEVEVEEPPSVVIESPPPEPELPEPEPEEPTPEPAEMPSWLRDLAPPEAEAEAEVEEPPSAEPSPEETEPAEPRPEPAALPEWLRDLAPSEAEAEVEEPPSAEPPPEEPPPEPAALPEWLQEVAPSEAEAPEAQRPGPEPAERPEWLREPTAPEIEAEAPSPPREAPLEEAEEAPEPSVSPFAEELDLKESEIPDWLTDLEPGEPAREEEVSPFPVETGLESLEEGLARAEIPEWLRQLKPSAEREEAAKEPMETEGLLKGLRGLVPPSPAIEAPSTYQSVSPGGTSEASLARAELLQSLLSRPVERPQLEVRERGVGIGQKLQRWLVAIVLVLVVLASLATQDVLTLSRPLSSAGATALHDAVDGLGATDHVLVAFDYGPAEADELNAVAEPILGHLLGRGVRISVVSTRPEGLTTAEALLGDVIASTDRYTASQYADLAYRPGGAAAVSQLLSAAEPSPTMLLVLTSRLEPLRRWVEQAYALYGDGLPVVAGVSAALEPAAGPYLDANAGQLKGAIHGLSGAAYYESLQETTGDATQRLNALAAGHIAIVALMIIGAILYAFGGAGREGK